MIYDLGVADLLPTGFGNPLLQCCHLFKQARVQEKENQCILPIGTWKMVLLFDTTAILSFRKAIFVPPTPKIFPLYFQLDTKVDLPFRGNQGSGNMRFPKTRMFMSMCLSQIKAIVTSYPKFTESSRLRAISPIKLASTISTFDYSIRFHFLLCPVFQLLKLQSFHSVPSNPMVSGAHVTINDCPCISEKTAIILHLKQIHLLSLSYFKLLPTKHLVSPLGMLQLMHLNSLTHCAHFGHVSRILTDHICMQLYFLIEHFIHSRPFLITRLPS